MRRPRGYEGKDHVTIGSDIMSVLQVVDEPERILGIDTMRKLETMDPNGWYPIKWLLDLMRTVETNVGHYGLMQMGRALFKLSHEARVLEVATCARDIIYGIDDMYHHANRGEAIGGWKVVKFEPGYAELEKNTPHHCVMEQGILAAALSAVKAPALVAQTTCFRRRGPLCVYTVSSTVTDERWSRGAG